MDETSNTFSSNVFEKYPQKNIATDISTQLELIKSIKNICSENLGCIDIQVLLNHTLNLPEKTFENLDSIYLLNYGKSLVNTVVRNNFYENKLVLHLDNILSELKRRDLSLEEKVIIYAWQKFEKHNFLHKKTIQIILKYSVKVFEKVVLDWLENKFQVDYYVRLSSDIPEVFQLTSSILHEILKVTMGNQRVLGLVSAFIDGVIFTCQNEKKNFLKLYPRECSWMVSLIMIPPSIYALRPEKINLVLHFIFSEFQLDKHKISLLLSHFSEWIPLFKNFLTTHDK